MAQTITLNFKIIGQSLERLDENRIVEKAKNYVNAHFEFNELWDDTTKAILIEGSGLRYKAYLNENNECSIPNRVVRHDGFTLTVVGEDADKNITITTNDLFISILSNNVTDDTPSYVEVIESNTLDVTREGEKYNIEIPDTYENCYVVQSTDITNFIPTPQGNMQVTLSQELEDVILEFKKLVYIDWENQFPALYDNSTKVSLFTPVKFANLDGTDVHTFSCIDGAGDITIAFYQNNGNWYFAKITNQLLTQETGQMLFYTELETKVIPNPTLDGTESDLTGLEVLGTKYKVGGGSLYMHVLSLSYSTQYDVTLTIYSDDSVAYTYDTLKAKNLGFVQITGSYQNRTKIVNGGNISSNNGISYYGIDASTNTIGNNVNIWDYVTKIL